MAIPFKLGSKKNTQDIVKQVMQRYAQRMQQAPANRFVPQPQGQGMISSPGFKPGMPQFPQVQETRGQYADQMMQRNAQNQGMISSPGFRPDMPFQPQNQGMISSPGFTPQPLKQEQEQGQGMMGSPGFATRQPKQARQPVKMNAPMDNRKALVKQRATASMAPRKTIGKPKDPTIKNM